ncbi:MAG TPA: hypothetical protein VIT00_07285, partial [Terrimicrobiaceae bacterium]
RNHQEGTEIAEAGNSSSLCSLSLLLFNLHLRLCPSPLEGRREDKEEKVRLHLILPSFAFFC